MTLLIFLINFKIRFLTLDTRRVYNDSFDLGLVYFDACQKIEKTTSGTSQRLHARPRVVSDHLGENVLIA